jgi:cytochrome c oxidase cbb3-type subunit IV
MIKEVASHIPGIGILPMISLGIFFLFFVGLGLWVWRANKSEMEDRGKMPLE